jgi:hypothetical protein
MWGSWLHTLTAGSPISLVVLHLSLPSPQLPSLLEGDCHSSVLAVSHMWGCLPGRREVRTDKKCVTYPLPTPPPHPRLGMQSWARTMWKLSLFLGLPDICGLDSPPQHGSAGLPAPAPLPSHRSSHGLALTY